MFHCQSAFNQPCQDYHDDDAIFLLLLGRQVMVAMVSGGRWRQVYGERKLDPNDIEYDAEY